MVSRSNLAKVVDGGVGQRGPYLKDDLFQISAGVGGHIAGVSNTRFRKTHKHEKPHHTVNRRARKLSPKFSSLYFFSWTKQNAEISFNLETKHNFFLCVVVAFT